MNILDGTKQIAQEAQRQIGEQAGADGVELSSHPYSALDHEPAQGRQFSLEEYQKMQSGRDFQDADGNQCAGFRRAISQWNCRHFASYIILGVSPRRYTDQQLRQWREANHKGCEIDGQHYTIYQASQLMRKLETKIRQQKDIANLAKASGDDVLRREAQANIRDLKAKYAQVAKKAGLRQRTDKMAVESYQAPPVESHQVPPPLQNAAGQTIIEVKKTTLTGEPGSITQYTSKGGGIERNYYGADGRQIKQIANYDHGNPKKHPFGARGEHAHDYIYDDFGKLKRTLRELSEEERRENGDIL